MSGRDGGLAAGYLPERHHVVGGQALVAPSYLVHSGHFEGVDSEGLEVGDVEDCLRSVGGEDLVVVPVSVLALQDVDDVVGHLAVVSVEGRGPGENTAPRVELHDQRLSRPTGNI